MAITNNIYTGEIYKINENFVNFSSQNSKKATLRVEKTIIVRKNLNIIDLCLESVQEIFSKNNENFTPISAKYDWVEVEK